MLAVFLGAGFSFVGGVPLAGQLFDSAPKVDRIVRRKLVQRVRADWLRWHERHGGQPEEYLAFLEQIGDQRWKDAVWYVALIIALKMGGVERIGMQDYLTVVRHNLDRTTQIQVHETFWTKIFTKTNDVGVVTTNYDILPERGLRHIVRPRVPRPGFNYGTVGEQLAGGGYPSYSHIQKICAMGSVPLFKLHGSVSWSIRDDKLIRYHDCRPAVQGNAAILAPVTEKSLPNFLEETWQQASELLRKSNNWIIVGYSLPDYDLLIRKLLRENGSHNPRVAVFDPDASVGDKYRELLPNASISGYQGLPLGLDDLESFVKTACAT